MPYVVDNPDWYVLELKDGFGSHLNCYKANLLRAEHKILSLKEEGDSSHINQAYDKLAAKSDKNVQRTALSWLRKERRYNSNIIDQYGLIACGLAAVRHTGRHPEIWVDSFVATNTHPTRQISFEDWCVKIAPHLQASDSFHLIKQNAEIDEYTLLPAFWQAMAPEDKKLAVEIVRKHGDNAWDLNCCRELIRSLSLTMSELSALQPCIFCAMDNPTHLDRGLDEEEDGVDEVVQPDEVIAAEAARKKAHHGLDLFVRAPEGLTGIKLFDHMCNFRQRSYAHKEKDHKISDHLDCQPRTSHQHDLMKIDYHLRMQGTIMGDVMEGVPLEKAAQVRLDNLGQVKSRSQFINDPRRLNALRDRLELLRSLGRAEELAQMEEKEKTANEAADLRFILRPAIQMYLGGETSKRTFTKNHAKSILLIVFNAKPSKTAKKQHMIDSIAQENEKHPGLLQDVLDSADDNVFVPELPPLDVTSPSTADNQLPSDSPIEPPAAAAATSLAPWLYNRCVSTVEKMQTTKTPLDVALMVLQVLDAISKLDEEDAHLHNYQLAFFNAMSRFGGGCDVDFNMDMADNVDRMLNDTSLTESALRALAN